MIKEFKQAVQVRVGVHGVIYWTAWSQRYNNNDVNLYNIYCITIAGDFKIQVFFF